MSAYSPNQIETMALGFARRQAEALSVLELPFKMDGQMFEAMLDQVADNIKLSEAGWDLFASVARLTFFGINDVPASDRRRWGQIADMSRAELHDEWAADQKLQAADFAHDQRGEAA